MVCHRQNGHLRSAFPFPEQSGSHCIGFLSLVSLLEDIVCAVWEVLDIVGTAKLPGYFFEGTRIIDTATLHTVRAHAFFAYHSTWGTVEGVAGGRREASLCHR